MASRMTMGLVVALALSLGTTRPARAEASTRKAAPTEGRTGIPLNTRIRIEGRFEIVSAKGWSDGPTLFAQRINGIATQRCMDLRLSGVDRHGQISREGPPSPLSYNLEPGRTYELIGHETGSWVGGQPESGPPVQSTSHPFFHRTFVVEEHRVIAPIILHPRDFAGRTALFDGTAVSLAGQSFVVGREWLVLIDPQRPWRADEAGKRMTCFGQFGETESPGIYRLSDGEIRLRELDDQVGREVRLRGRAINKSGHWYFVSRGAAIALEEVPATWGPETVNETLEITGILARRETVNQPYRDEIRETARFVLRNPSPRPVGELLAPEEWGEFWQERVQ